MSYGIGLTALFFVVILVLSLILYLEESRRLAVEFEKWRGRLGIDRAESIEFLSIIWNKKYPDDPRNFDDQTMRRWERGAGPFPVTYFKIMQIFNDKAIFDAIAAHARRHDLDTLDAFAGKRTPGSPPRMVFMRMEAFEDFYADEFAALVKRRSTKKRRRRRKH